MTASTKYDIVTVYEKDEVATSWHRHTILKARQGTRGCKCPSSERFCHAVHLKIQSTEAMMAGPRAWDSTFLSCKQTREDKMKENEV